jgi:hypothetical protein
VNGWIPPPCDHEFTVTETDNWGRDYTVCEECGAEVDVEDLRDFEAIIEARAERRWSLYSWPDD